MEKAKVEALRDRLRQVQTFCMQNKIPCIALVQYRNEEGEIANLSVIVSPELVDFDLHKSPSDDKHVDRRIYDISNIIQGGYRTIPILRDDEDEEDE